MLDCCCWHGVSFFPLFLFLPLSPSLPNFCRILGSKKNIFFLPPIQKVAGLIPVVFICMCVKKNRSLLLLILISRSKLVPDFALTLHFLHLVATSLYSRSVPRNFLWWMLQAASASLMISLGIWSCRWRELKPINFGAAGAGEGKSEAAPTAGLLGEEGGRETGLGGEYEMVGINKGGGGS